MCENIHERVQLDSVQVWFKFSSIQVVYKPISILTHVKKAADFKYQFIFSSN